ncbi:MAG: CCA tRNA nucleotidyltransferase [Lachnospiraceae bacterium]|nr:CCA tRNA nucleotidyltransferase [Lachnospiraceae bacterium]
MRINVPDNANYILDKLGQAGFEAYVVGGCVRDSILGKTPSDWDVTTSAKPEDVKRIFRRTVDTGIKHGTVTVLLDKESYEVTTYRIDGDYGDGRHPDSVLFTDKLKEDLRRRDFTINAMAYNDRDGLVDIFGGIGDIEKKLIRCVGVPDERFSEDALRMMRAVRFSGQLGYEIDEDTLKAIEAHSSDLRKISAERIRDEFVKLLISEHPEKLRIAYRTGLTKVFLPEFDTMMRTKQIHPHHMYDVGEHTIHAVMEIDAEKDLRLAMFFHDIAKPPCLTVDKEGITHFHGHPEMGAKMTVDIMRRLRFDNDTIERVSRLVKFHDYGNGMDITKKVTRRAMRKMGKDIFPAFLKIKRADILSQSMYLREEKLAELGHFAGYYEEIIRDEECTGLKELAVNGSDLIAHGMSPGRELGETLNKLLDRVVDNPKLNEKSKLLELVDQWQGI